MTAQLTKNSIDLGIVTTQPAELVKFYRDTVGLPMQGEMPMPGGGNMVRLLAGDSVIKIVSHGKAPGTAAAPGGIQGATGYRYWTISVSNLAALAERCASAGYKIAVKPVEFRPGVHIAIVEDPDGNWVEFLQTA